MKILFVIAHPDDEAFGPYGTMATLAKEHEVYLLCMCNGKRPGSEYVSESRLKAFENNCTRLGLVNWHVLDNADLTLEYNATVKELEKCIKEIQPEVVYTHNISDLNKDHRTVADATMVACRPMPGSSVNELYFYEVQSSTDWSFAQVQPAFAPTVYQDISEFILTKKQALANYTTEAHAAPDARSLDAMVASARHRGCQVGVDYAEAFQLVFSRRRKTQ